MAGNKYRKMQLIIILCIITAIMVGNIAYAKENEEGSITIALTDGKKGTEKEGVIFGYVKVADMINGECQVIEKYTKDIEPDRINTAKEAEEAAAKIKTSVKSPDGTVVTDADGRAEIKELEVGVYLVYVEEQAGYEKIHPFLVSVPTWNEESGEMDFHIKVIPKHEALVKKAPIAPQTNLENSYEKLFAMSFGSVLLACILLYGSNRKRAEK